MDTAVSEYRKNGPVVLLSHSFITPYTPHIAVSACIYSRNDGPELN
jgi:hypothetical protein